MNDRYLLDLKNWRVDRVIELDNKAVKEASTAKERRTLKVHDEPRIYLYNPVCFKVQISAVEIGWGIHAWNHSGYGLFYSCLDIHANAFPDLSMK